MFFSSITRATSYLIWLLIRSSLYSADLIGVHFSACVTWFARSKNLFTFVWTLKSSPCRNTVGNITPVHSMRISLLTYFSTETCIVWHGQINLLSAHKISGVTLAGLAGKSCWQRTLETWPLMLNMMKVSSLAIILSHCNNCCHMIISLHAWLGLTWWMGLWCQADYVIQVFGFSDELFTCPQSTLLWQPAC